MADKTLCDGAYLILHVKTDAVKLRINLLCKHATHNNHNSFVAHQILFFFQNKTSYFLVRYFSSLVNVATHLFKWVDFE